MGYISSLLKPLTTKKKEPTPWGDSIQSTLSPKRTATSTSTCSIATTTTTPIPTAPIVPTDNIFIPIQTDIILPQIPIGEQHPVPRKGIEDDEYRTLHTNKFYANAFLGEQNQPVWTHPYVLWWGKGGKGFGGFASWGMNVGHCEEGDVEYGDGVPAKVLSIGTNLKETSG
jgi:endo-1,3(4)-beta-glucanase